MRAKLILTAALALAAASSLAGTAAAQANGQDSIGQDPEIVVSGQRAIAPEAARRYVRGIATVTQDQLARYGDPVCPTVIGLPDEYGDIVVRRIRQVAGRSGVPVAPEKCAPNLVVIIAANADQLVADMRKTVPQLFAGLELSDIRKAMREGPAHVWNTSEIRSEGGQRRKEGGGVERTAGTMTIQSASIISLPTRQVTVQSVAVLDSGALLGKSLMQVADYVTMRTLAGARPPRADEAPRETILSLFDAGATPPPSVTFLDATYLEGLYKTRGNQKAIYQLNDIAQRVIEGSTPAGVN